MRWLVFLLLAGCATAPKAPPVAVSASCVPSDVGPPGVYADANVAAAPDPATRYLQIATANEQRKARLATTEPVIAGCR